MIQIYKRLAPEGTNASVLASGIWGSNPKLTVFAKIAPKFEVFIKFNIECTPVTEPFFHRMCILPPVIILENIFLWQTRLHILPEV